MKAMIAIACAALIGAAAGPAFSQETQQRPDARYQNPSGQDSNPGKTTVKPTQTAPKSSNPEDARSSTKGEAAEQTYSGVKKADDAAGCSTPTTAADAGVKGNDANRRANGKKTVCTTAGDKGAVPAKQAAPR